ncbi:MAG: tetratricopeptide repeat protein [Paramuribaculum sp.]|nr:tetratricopeptide repeat protein [Paramuribaculum sp.]
MKARHIILFLFICTIAACTTRHDPRVESLFSLAESVPEAALDSIDALDSLHLSSTDRMLLRLATIKATDKADRQLPGDTAILPLVDYYSSHETERYYPTALYYAGRIYSESGDYPTALRYFQDALDLLPENTPDLNLRAAALSQTAAILANLRLFDQAEPYFTEALEIDRQMRDTINMIYDLENLANITLRNGDCYTALYLFLSADSLTSKKFPANTPYSKSNIAYAYYKSGDINSALTAVKESLIPSNTKDLNIIYSQAATIYYNAGLYDSTYQYASKLIGLGKDSNKRLGYYYLIQPELSDFIPHDSINSYMKNYNVNTEIFLSKNSNQAALIQNSYYNYATHELKRISAEKSKNKFLVIALMLAIILLSLIVVTLFVSNRSHKRKLRLTEALNKIRELEKTISEQTMSNKLSPEPIPIDVTDLDSTSVIRDSLRKQLIDAAKLSNHKYVIPEVIYTSSEYSKVIDLIHSNKKITEAVLWDSLEDLTNKAFPKYKDNLLLLYGKTPRIEDMRTILLIKLGCRPSELQILLGLAKGSVSSRRAEISKRLLGELYELKTVDAAIRLL